MNSTQKIKVSAFVMMVILALGSSATMAGSMAAEEQMKGPAADFTLKNKAGGNLRLNDYRGKVVMLNFWASWCGPCRKELPLLNGLYSQYKDLDFVILGINVDSDSSLADKLLKDIKVDFPILLDPKSDISTQYKVEAMPSSFFIDRNGNLRFLHRGFEDGTEKTYEAHIRALIRE